MSGNEWRSHGARDERDRMVLDARAVEQRREHARLHALVRPWQLAQLAHDLLERGLCELRVDEALNVCRCRMYERGCGR